MEGAAGEPAVDQLHAADLNDAVLLLDFQSRGFSIENDLTHLSDLAAAASRRSMATLAS